MEMSNGFPLFLASHAPTVLLNSLGMDGEPRYRRRNLSTATTTDNTGVQVPTKAAFDASNANVSSIQSALATAQQALSALQAHISTVDAQITSLQGDVAAL